MTESYGKTTYINLSQLDVVDSARIVVDKIISDDPSFTRSIVKLKGYKVTIERDDEPQTEDS